LAGKVGRVFGETREVCVAEGAKSLNMMIKSILGPVRAAARVVPSPTTKPTGDTSMFRRCSAPTAGTGGLKRGLHEGRGPFKAGQTETADPEVD